MEFPRFKEKFLDSIGKVLFDIIISNFGEPTLQFGISRFNWRLLYSIVGYYIQLDFAIFNWMNPIQGDF